jgi:hypothetical protein
LNRLTWKETFFIFDKEYQELFEKFKACLISILILGYYNPDAELLLETDISDKVVAGILFQKREDQF